MHTVSERCWRAGHTGLGFDTGKRIKRAEGSVADAEGEARRAQVLARINGDEALTLTLTLTLTLNQP